MPINLKNSQPEVMHDLTLRLNAVLPQTQCQRCGFDGCLPYANAMANKTAKPNRCPPGGPNGLKTLSAILGEPENFGLTLDVTCGEVGPRTTAFIREDLCIGCTKCIDVCPTDAIVGAPKKLHFVITEFCTSCDLCLPPCPVDCITMTAIDDGNKFSWEQWSNDDAQRSRKRFEKKQLRINKISTAANQPATATAASMPQAAVINNALERAKAKAKKRLAENSIAVHK